MGGSIHHPRQWLHARIEIRQSGLYSENLFSICGEFRPGFDGVGLLGDEFRDATGGGGQIKILEPCSG
jgi:hypothetical protein